MRRLGILALTFLIFIGPFLSSGTAKGEDRLTIGISQFPANLQPNIESMMAKKYVLSMAQRPITAYDQDWQLICMLCTELPTIENGGAVPEPLADGGQGVAVTYTLHPEATWGDGVPVTTDDVVFTWEMGRHPKSGVGNFELFQQILSIDVHDAKTFTLHRDRLEFRYNAINDFLLVPAHLERPIFEAAPESYRLRNTFDTAPTTPGLYFGPYRIDEVVSGSHIDLVPNPTWYGPAPAFDRVTVRAIENTAAMEANLLSGGIDMIAGELGLTLDQALAFEKRHGDRFNVDYKSGLVYEHIDLNLDNPILQDRRVREALVLAIDREAVSAQLFDGRQPVAHSSVSPLDWVHSESLRKYPFDPDRARALLEEAGWGELRDGIRHNDAGEPLQLSFSTTAGNRSRELVQQVLQSQWRELGIDVRIQNQPARVFFGETVSKRQFSGMVMFAWISSPENPPRTTLHSEMIPTPENNWGGQNYTGYAVTEMDELIELIEVELDREARSTLWARLQALYAEDLPVIPLYWRANSYITPKWLEGVRPTGHQDPTVLWIEEWRRRP